MKNYILILFLTVLPFAGIFAQDEPEKDRPVRAPFESGYLIDNQTTMIPIEGTLEFVIQHKFGNFENGVTDFFGIYAAGSNIRLGLNYVPVTNFQVGLGLSKDKMNTDLNAKWTIFEQTRENTFPVAVALYGVLAIDGRSEDVFGSGKVRHSGEGLTVFSIDMQDRLSYFSQLIISRSFTHWFSVQTGVSFTHYNMVEPAFDHDKIALHFNGRMRFSPQSSFIFNYDAPLQIQQISEQLEVPEFHRPNLSFGWEISTSTHIFQIYAGNSSGIIPQEIIMWNANDTSFKDFALGFTITRLWNF